MDWRSFKGGERLIDPKVGDKVIVWKDDSLWIGTITKYIQSGYNWYIGHYPETWEMKIEDCDKGKSYSSWIGTTMTFTSETVFIGERTFCMYTDEKYKQVKAAIVALEEAQWALHKLLKSDEEVKKSE